MNLFNIFKKRKSYSCPSLNNHLHFSSRNALEPCCSANIGPFLVSDLSDKESIREYIKEKNKYIKLFKAGKLPKGCIDCVHLKPYNEITDFRINKIILNHYTQCDCACIYCSQGNTTIEKIKEDANRLPSYDILNFINELYDMDVIDRENLYVDFQGGNISCLKNYQEIVQIFLDRGVGTIYFPTNNIVYMPIIEKLLVMKKGIFCTALDAGCRETYLKIKQVDKFDKSINNLKRYIASVCNEPIIIDNIIVKYIMVNGYNDNLEEFSKFLYLMKEIKVKTIVVDINYLDIIRHTFTIPKHYYDIVNFAKEFCNSNNMYFGIPPYTEKVLKQGYSKK